MLDDFPIKDGLVVGHLAPDADSICSSIAFVRFLREHKKEAYFFLPDYVTPNLSWIIDNNSDIIITDKHHDFLKKAETFYVLDCEPSKARTGFNFPKNSNIINIDHHKSRFKDVAPDTEFNYGDYFYGKVQFEHKEILLLLENRVSVCSVLFTKFKIKNPLLAIGIYFDSVGLTINIKDSIDIISKLHVEEEELSNMISYSKYKGNKEQWDALVKLNTLWDDDKQVMFAFDNTRVMDANQMIYILNQYAETVVFFHKNKNVSLRTTNKEMDMSEIAQKRNGGGHRGAAGFRIKNKLELYKLLEEIKNEKTSNEERKNLAAYEKKLYSFFSKFK